MLFQSGNFPSSVISALRRDAGKRMMEEEEVGFTYGTKNSFLE